jgi:hypothetical protein
VVPKDAAKWGRTDEISKRLSIVSQERVLVRLAVHETASLRNVFISGTNFESNIISAL